MFVITEDFCASAHSCFLHNNCSVIECVTNLNIDAPGGLFNRARSSIEARITDQMTATNKAKFLSQVRAYF